MHLPDIIQPIGSTTIVGQTIYATGTAPDYGGYTYYTTLDSPNFDTIKIQPYVYQEEFIQANYIIVLYDRLKKYLAEGKMKYVKMVEETIDLLRIGRHGRREDAQIILSNLFATIDMDECLIETEKMKKRVNEIIPENLLVWEEENGE
jgi:hypothetical protein